MQVGINDEDSKLCMMPSCTEIDLLPYTCDKCHKTFCSKHIFGLTHNCPGFVDRSVVLCPICNVAVPLGSANESADVAVSRHIDHGCKLAQQRQQQARAGGGRTVGNRAGGGCTFQKCGKVDPVMVVCEECGGRFCMEHRSTGRHECVGAARRREAQKRKEEKEREKPVTPPPRTAPADGANGEKDYCTTPSNTYKTAHGKETERASDMVVLLVTFPNEHYVVPFYMRFAKRFSVGRALDLAVEQASLSSRQVAEARTNSPSGSRPVTWKMFNVSALKRNRSPNGSDGSAQPLPLSTLVSQAGINDSDVIFVTTSDSLPPYVLQCMKSDCKQLTKRFEGKSGSCCSQDFM